MYGIHGNEPSASNVTPLIAHFLTATEDPDIMEQLEDVVIILNPVLNPDGHDRFANWTNSRAGLNPAPIRMITSTENLIPPEELTTIGLISTATGCLISSPRVWVG